jgi:hypothetical protein
MRMVEPPRTQAGRVPERAAAAAAGVGVPGDGAAATVVDGRSPGSALAMTASSSGG